MTKEEIKEISNIVMETFMQSDEFKQIIRQVVELGFYAGAKSIAKVGGVVDFFQDKEDVVNEALSKVDSAFKLEDK